MSNQNGCADAPFRAFCEAVPVPFCVTDADGVPACSNRMLRALLNLTEEANSVLAGIHPDDAAATNATWARAVAAPGTRVAFRNRFRNSDGETRQLNWHVRANAESGMVWCVVRDCTVRDRERRRHVALLRSLYEDTPVMMHSINADGVIEFVSNHWLERLGYARHEVLGRRSTEFLTDDSRQLAREVLADFFKTGHCSDIAYQFVAKNGAPVDVLLTATAELDAEGQFVRSLAVLVDVTERNRAVAALEHQRALLEAFFQAVPDPMVITDANHRIVRANRAVTDAFGYSEDELRGRRSEILHADGDEPEIFDPAFNPDQSIHGTHFRRKAGEVFPAETVAADLLGSDDEIIGHVDVIRDVTEREVARQRMKDTTARARAIVDALPDVLLSIGPDETWIDAVAPRGDGAPVAALSTIPLSALAAIRDAARVVRTDGVVRSVDFEHADGEETRNFEARIVPGARHEVLCVVRDITERSRMLHALELANAQLKASNAELEQFAYAASHDLQAPLRTVSSFCQLLRDHCDGTIDDTAQTYIDFAVEGAERMRTLIHDLLEYSRVGRRPSEPSEVSAEHAVREASLDLREAIRDSNAILEFGTLPRLRAHLHELSQVFRNVIGNAIKYRGEAPPLIQIEVADEHSHWRFTVRDNGIGIEPDFHECIFDVFRRLHPRSQYGGTGIGLAICRKVVELNGGRIWVESAVGDGSAFCFTWPKADRTQSEPTTRAANPSDDP